MTEQQQERQSEAEGIGAIGGHAATLQRLSTAAAPDLAHEATSLSSRRDAAARATRRAAPWTAAGLRVPSLPCPGGGGGQPTEEIYSGAQIGSLPLLPML
mgnify:CR=1 FL=1